MIFFSSWPGRRRQSFGIPIEEWKDAELQDGTPRQVPAGLNPVRLDNGDQGIYCGDTLVAVMPVGGYVFNQVYNIQANAPPEKAMAISDTALAYREERRARPGGNRSRLDGIKVGAK